METSQENLGTQGPVIKEEEPSINARLVAGIVVLILAVVIAIAIVPGWRAAVLDIFFQSEEERLLQSLESFEDVSEEQLLELAASLDAENEPLTEEQANMLVESLGNL